MHISAKKSLYIALFGILGTALFLVLEKCFLLVLFWLKVDIGSANVQLFDYLGRVGLGLLGLWFGVHQGIGWYERIYGTGKCEWNCNQCEVKENRTTSESGSLSQSDWEIEDLTTKPSQSKGIKVSRSTKTSALLSKTPTKRVLRKKPVK